MPCIGYSDERIHAYLARDLTYSKRNLDEGEFLETSRVPMSDLVQQALNASIQDAKTVIALLWARTISQVLGLNRLFDVEEVLNFVISPPHLLTTLKIIYIG
jgi:hypothetical protein